jgi:hypothetical protein
LLSDKKCEYSLGDKLLHLRFLPNTIRSDPHIHQRNSSRTQLFHETTLLTATADYRNITPRQKQTINVNNHGRHRLNFFTNHEQRRFKVNREEASESKHTMG